MKTWTALGSVRYFRRDNAVVGIGDEEEICNGLAENCAGEVDNQPPLTLHRAAPWGPAPLELMPVELDPAERVVYQTMWRQFRAAIAERVPATSPVLAASHRRL